MSFGELSFHPSSKISMIWAGSESNAKRRYWAFLGCIPPWNSTVPNASVGLCTVCRRIDQTVQLSTEHPRLFRCCFLGLPHPQLKLSKQYCATILIMRLMYCRRRRGVKWDSEDGAYGYTGFSGVSKVTRCFDGMWKIFLLENQNRWMN